jgi:hypothetical protein
LALQAERLAEILRQTGRVTGLASGDDLARSLQISVEEADLPEGVCGTCDPFVPSVMVAPNLRPPRRQYTICHELAELHVAERLDESIHERLCQNTAAALLMPRQSFLNSVREQGLDLLALRMRWVHCSYEAIASRVAELIPGVVASAWEWEHAKWRRCVPDLHLPEALAEAEAMARSEVYLLPRGVVQLKHEGVSVHGWRTSALPNRAILLCELN